MKVAYKNFVAAVMVASVWPVTSIAQTVQGSVTGKVLTARTRLPISGASVTVEGTDWITKTGEDGTFRLASVPIGTRTLVVRALGYGKMLRSVTVAENGLANVEFSLEASANVLDQIVVTGSVIAVAQKEIPTAITVITAKELEERGITRIDQLFRGDVPGLFAANKGSSQLNDEVQVYSRGATMFTGQSNFDLGIVDGTNPIKTYVDGVEMSDAKYLSQIDPKSIERIEILTGPQASTIYGSNALNGVMQIFTKRGTSSRPQISLSLLSGWVQNNFSSKWAPQHDPSVQISGMEEHFSYNIGGGWNYLGSWTPARQTVRYSAFGGSRLELPVKAGRISTNISYRRGLTRNRRTGSPGQTTTEFSELGWWSPSGSNGHLSDQLSDLHGKTFGASIGYSPNSWWSHDVGIGRDVSDVESISQTSSFNFLSDTNLLYSKTYQHRKSYRYTTTVRAPVTSLLQGTLTAGADAWNSLFTSISSSGVRLIGPFSGATTINRRASHNAGGFTQLQVGFADKLFVTYGLRAEWNPNFGDEAQPNLSPRYGAAYTQEYGTLTAKVRASYGHSTRPPDPRQKRSQTASKGGPSTIIPFYGDIETILENPDLGPDFQQGWEGGLEFYIGNRGSLVVTRYNQTVDDIILAAKVDSVRSKDINPTPANSRDSDGYGYWYQRRNLNVASIRNQGWELQGSVNLGPFTTNGTYSWTKSRVIGVSQKYASFFSSDLGLRPGATFQYLAEHTWAGGITYSHTGTRIGLNINGIGQLLNFRDKFVYEFLLPGALRLTQNVQRMNSDSYISINRRYTMADLNASHKIRSNVEGVLEIHNLTDLYVNDYDGGDANIGRQGKVGLRIRW